VLTERSVSKAAVRLGMHQPAVSASLKRLRDFAGDPLLVRSGAQMVPTDAALRMVAPAASILRAAQMLFSDARGFDPALDRSTFRLAASDYLDPLFLPQLVAELKSGAPLCQIDIQPLTASVDYRAQLAQGEVDLVIGNWPTPPDDLHLARLFGDEVVSLVANHHPAVRRGWDAAAWLAAEHIAPGALHPGARGVIDSHLDAPGPAAQHHSALPAFRPDPSHGGINIASLNHRPAVLRTLPNPATPYHPALPHSIPTHDVLPALA
jgi:DNA-binding transcriptional LysR family regulator